MCVLAVGSVNLLTYREGRGTLLTNYFSQNSTYLTLPSYLTLITHPAAGEPYQVFNTS